PDFDLNQRNTAKPEQMKNRAVIDMMEPGSTFKIVTAAAALNEKKVRPDTTIFCENGAWNYGGGGARRAHPARSSPLRGAERAGYSCEIEQHRCSQARP